MIFEAPSRHHRVILVDDDPEVLAALERLTRAESYDVLPTPDPEEALDWLRKWDVGVLLADYRMAAMSGTLLLAKAREISPCTAQILVTGFAGEQVIVAGRKAGLFAVFPKPWDDGELKRLIRDRLRDRELEGALPAFRKVRSIRRTTLPPGKRS
jgi:DNA-binding NtrC family response regulator